MSNRELYYPSRDLADFLSLRAAVWGSDHPHSSVAFQQWLYADAHPEAPRGILVRQRDGLPVGFAGLCVKRLWVDGVDTKLAYGLEYMILPHLGGLMSGRIALRVARGWLALAREMRCTFGLTFPNENASRIEMSKHVGLAPLFQPALLVRPLHTARLTERLHHRVSRRATTAALWLAALNSWLVSGLGARPPGACEQFEEFGPEFDALWAAAALQLDVAVVRDARYLSWRYQNHPVYNYTCLAWRAQGRLDGFAVASPRRLTGVDALLLIDLLVISWDGPVAEALVHAVVRHACGSGRDVVAALAVPESKFYRALRRCGFYRVPQWLLPQALMRAAGIVFTASASPAGNPAHWHFTWGDTDVV